jgi:pimeloyl-ACP methyl ester carboxylesterase
MNYAAPSWPLVGQTVHILHVFVIALSAFILSGTGLAHAGDTSSATTLVPLHGKFIEQRVLSPENSAGTVVLENGSRAGLEGWSRVMDRLEANYGQPGPAQAWSVFSYNRPGIGHSVATDRPRDGRQIVADLRELLRQQGLSPPYLLVGHSLGGLYMQLFARMYPHEVQGLVLVDSLYPGIIKRPEDFPFYARWGKALLFNGMVSREIDAIYKTGEDVMALPWSAQIPVTRLVNVPKSAGAIAVDFGVINADEATISRVRAMYPGANTVVVDSDHQIQKENPEIVVQAIQELMMRR